MPDAWDQFPDAPAPSSSAAPADPFAAFPDAPQAVVPPPTLASQGYGRGGRAPTPEEMAARRDNALTRTIEGAIADPIGTARAGAEGFNNGVARLPGVPVDTIQNV